MTNDPNRSSDAYDFVPALGDLRDRVVFGEIWRPDLAKRDRSLILCAALISLYRTEELKGHFNRAITNGVTKEELQEVITHLAFYAGWPNAVNAARVFEETFARA